ACTPDGFVAQPEATETGKPFLFDRLGVRVPAVLVSPWVARGTVGPGAGAANGRGFEPAAIPPPAAQPFPGNFDQRSPREKQADTFLDLLTLNAVRADTPDFDLG